MDVPDAKPLGDDDLESVRIDLLDFAEADLRNVTRAFGPKDRDLELVRAVWTIRLVPPVAR
jgi:hypothetical protein